MYMCNVPSIFLDVVLVLGWLNVVRALRKIPARKELFCKKGPCHFSKSALLQKGSYHFLSLQTVVNPL